MTMSTSAGHTPWLPAQLKALPKLPSGLAPCWYNTTQHYALRGAYDGYKMSIQHRMNALLDRSSYEQVHEIKMCNRNACGGFSSNDSVQSVLRSGFFLSQDKSTDLTNEQKKATPHTQSVIK